MHKKKKTRPAVRKKNIHKKNTDKKTGKKHNGWWWGRSVSVDLHGCNPARVNNKAALRTFVRKLTRLLRMHRVGPVEVKRFGHGRLRGYSLMQFIETSSITAHFDERGRRAFIDVFSCKQYNAKKVAAFCKRFFMAKDARMNVEERR